MVYEKISFGLPIKSAAFRTIHPIMKTSFVFSICKRGKLRMEENHNSNNGMLPQIRPTGSFLAFWSVLLGGFGLASDCLPLFSIWNLPAGLFLGLIGIACAVLSRQGKPFTQQAQLGLILSVISAVCGLMMALFIIFVYDTMDTNTPMGHYFRQVFETASQALSSTSSSRE